MTGRPSLRWVDRNSRAEETEFLEIRALFYVSVGGCSGKKVLKTDLER